MADATGTHRSRRIRRCRSRRNHCGSRLTAAVGPLDAGVRIERHRPRLSARKGRGRVLPGPLSRTVQARPEDSPAATLPFWPDNPVNLTRRSVNPVNRVNSGFELCRWKTFGARSGRTRGHPREDPLRRSAIVQHYASRANVWIFRRESWWRERNSDRTFSAYAVPRAVVGSLLRACSSDILGPIAGPSLLLPVHRRQVSR
jgi:hypothetical protein